MRQPRSRRQRPAEAVYWLTGFGLISLLLLSGLHDDRLSLDRQCVKYASARACRVF